MKKTSITILLVEDEAIIALSTRQKLEKNGYAVVVVHSGEEAVEIATEHPEISLILMDIDLGGGIKGTDAARRILERRHLPIVFLTSHQEPRYVNDAEEITRYGYILKSSGEFVLIRSIKTALELFDAYQKTRRSEARFRALFENTPNISIQGYTADGTIHFWNDAARVVYGYTAEEAIGRNLTELIIPPEMRAAVAAGIRESAEQEQPILPGELKLLRKDGSTAHVFSSHSVVAHEDEEPELFCLDMDISDRVQAEAEYQLLVEHQTDLVVKVDADGIFQFVSESYCRLFGKPREELIGFSFVPLVHEEDRGSTMEAMQNLYQPPHTCHLEQRAMTARGWRWLEWIDTAVLDADGAVVAIIGSGRDVTERKEAELLAREREAAFHRTHEELLASEARFRAAFTGSVAAFAISTQREGRYLEVNEGFVALTGFPREELVGATSAELRLLDPEVRENIVAQAGKDSGFVLSRTPIHRKDGTHREVLFSLSELELSGEPCFLVTAVDISEISAAQRRLEELVLQKDRLMQELNHRVKNNINMVSALVALKDDELGDGVDLSDIRNQIDAIGTVHQILQRTDNFQCVDLAVYLDELIPHVFSLSSPVQTECHVQAEVGLIPTGTTVILGVIINELATNALKHGFVKGEEGVFTVTVGRSAEAVTIAVSNSGRPFPPEVDPTAGSTLGLRLVHALVEQANGTITLTREPQTTFTIVIPAVKIASCD